MKAFTTALVAVVAAALAVGCDDEGSTTLQQTTGADDAGPLVVYERTGGIASTPQHMVIEQDGSATVEVEGPADVGAEFKLSDGEIAQLRALLDDATLESPEPSGCADCYVYAIEYDGRTASFDQTNFPPGTEPVVELLSEILERETPTGPARDGA